MVQKKKRLTFLMMLLICSVLPGAASDLDMALHVRLKSMSSSVPPEIYGKSVLFTYAPSQYNDNHIRSVGIAFSHEFYRTIHPLKRVIDSVSSENPVETGLFFLLYEIPKGMEELEYRYVVDGIWMADPRAVRNRRDSSGQLISLFPIPMMEYEVQTSPERGIHGDITFRFKDQPGSRVYLAGSFNDWDPFMYRMKEHPGMPGLYSITLSLPEGKYFYQYIRNGKRISDPLNGTVALKGDGSRVSVISIN